MVIKIDEFGGTDWVDGDILYSADLIPTIKYANNSIGTESATDIVIASSANLADRITTCNSYTINSGQTITLTTAKTHIIVAKEHITINGDVDGIGAGGHGALGWADVVDGECGLCSAGGQGGYDGSDTFPDGSGSYQNFISSGGSGDFSSAYANEMKFFISQISSMNYYSSDAVRFFGGGGGTGGGAEEGAGGNGGAGLILIAPKITISGSINLNAGDSVSGGASSGGGGGGAGGALFIYSENILTLTDSTLTVDGTDGSSGYISSAGGNGGAGGLLIYIYGSLIGTPSTSASGGSGAGDGEAGDDGEIIAYSSKG